MKTNVLRRFCPSLSRLRRSAPTWTPAAALVLAISSCVMTVDAVVFDNDCWTVVGGQLKANSETGAWSFNGCTVTRDHSGCPDIEYAVLEMGIDKDGDGVLDPDEIVKSFASVNNGNQVSFASASGNHTGDKGDLLIHFEVKVEGQDKPLVSQTEVVKAPPAH